jgi:hypothetical protein
LPSGCEWSCPRNNFACATIPTKHSVTTQVSRPSHSRSLLGGAKPLSMSGIQFRCWCRSLSGAWAGRAASKRAPFRKTIASVPWAASIQASCSWPFYPSTTS